jgi:hypothetical protein
VKLGDPDLSAHNWLAEAVREGLAGLKAEELASFPIETPDAGLERLMIATDLGLVEGTLTGPPVDGMPGLVLDLRLWRDVPVSARARVDTHHGTHLARLLMSIGGHTVSSYELRTRQAANDFIAEALNRASRVGGA